MGRRPRGATRGVPPEIGYAGGAPATLAGRPFVPVSVCDGVPKTSVYDTAAMEHGSSALTTAWVGVSSPYSQITRVVVWEISINILCTQSTSHFDRRCSNPPERLRRALPDLGAAETYVIEHVVVEPVKAQRIAGSLPPSAQGVGHGGLQPRQRAASVEIKRETTTAIAEINSRIMIKKI